METKRCITVRPSNRLARESGILCVDVFTSGELVCAGVGCDVSIWSRGELLKVLKGHRQLVTAVAFSPDGAQIASCSKESRYQDFRLWSCESGDCIREFGLKSENHHRRAMTSLCFSPDGLRLVTGSKDFNLRLWEVATGNCIEVFEGHKNWVNAVAFHPADRIVASCSDDRTVKIWCIDRNTPFCTLEGHSLWVTCVAFHTPSGSAADAAPNTQCARRSSKYYSRTVVSGSCDRTIRVWDFIRKTCLFTLPGHTNSVTGVSFIGDYVVSSSRDSSCKLFSINISFAHSAEAMQVQPSAHPDFEECVEATNLKIPKGSDTSNKFDPRYQSRLDIPHAVMPDGTPPFTFDPIFGSNDPTRPMRVAILPPGPIKNAIAKPSIDTRTTLEIRNDFELLKRILGKSLSITGACTGHGVETTNVSCKGKCIATLREHKDWVNGVSSNVSAEGDVIVASCGDDSKIQLYALQIFVD